MLWSVARSDDSARFEEWLRSVQDQLDLPDYYRDPLDPTIGCWPKCLDHDAGLDAVVHDERAVWWCRFGSHAVAAIGELGS